MFKKGLMILCAAALCSTSFALAGKEHKLLCTKSIDCPCKADSKNDKNKSCKRGGPQVHDGKGGCKCKFTAPAS